ncbi:hypothetical protein ACJJTC_016012 [Scirpophaga incertulas]
MNPDLIVESNPAKRIKLSHDGGSSVEGQRTVATMCGAWRPEEEDGGMILVFKKREPCLSPDPLKECDYPENIKDFWLSSFNSSEDNQMSLYTVISSRKHQYDERTSVLKTEISD